MTEPYSVDDFSSAMPQEMDFYELGKMMSEPVSENASVSELAPDFLGMECRSYRLFSMIGDENSFVGFIFFNRQNSPEAAECFEEFGNILFSQCLNEAPGLWVSPPASMFSSTAIRIAQQLEDTTVRKYLHMHEGSLNVIWVLLGQDTKGSVGRA